MLNFFSSLYSKKPYITLFFCMACTLMNAQYHLQWDADRKDLGFLKNQTLLRLGFDLNNYSVKDIPNSKYYFDKPDSLKEIAMVKFEKAFNEKAGGKLSGKTSLVINSYNYILKVIPVKYYIDTAKFIPQCNTCIASYSYYVKAEYWIQVWNITDQAPLATLTLTNLTNMYPMSTTAGDNKRYSKNIDEEINRSMIRAGTETAKYLLKLIKKSK